MSGAIVTMMPPGFSSDAQYGSSWRRKHLLGEVLERVAAEDLVDAARLERQVVDRRDDVDAGQLAHVDVHVAVERDVTGADVEPQRCRLQRLGVDDAASRTVRPSWRCP